MWWARGASPAAHGARGGGTVTWAPVIERVQQEFSRRGPAGLLRFLASRMARLQYHRLFRYDNDGAALTPRQWRGYRVVLTTRERHAVHSRRFAGAFAAVARQGGEEYLAAVARGEAALVLILCDEAPAHYAFLLRESRTVAVLGEEPGAVALIGNAYTWPAHRGRGLHPYGVYRRGRLARRLGYAGAASETARGNVASQRGLTKGGFRWAGTVWVAVLANRLALGWSSARSFPPYVRWLQ